MGLFIGVAAVIAAVAAHVGLVRLPWPGNAVTKFLAVGALVGVSVVVYQAHELGISREAVATVLLYAFLCELYIFLFTLVMGSISASLLIRLRGGPLTELEIDRAYSDTLMVDNRLRRLHAARLLERAGTGYRVTARGARLVEIFGWLGRFFRHTP
jgi:hypothetical protein